MSKQIERLLELPLKVFTASFKEVFIVGLSNFLISAAVSRPTVPSTDNPLFS